LDTQHPHLIRWWDIACGDCNPRLLDEHGEWKKANWFVPGGQWASPADMLREHEITYGARSRDELAGDLRAVGMSVATPRRRVRR
jgi:hypothetical protein